MIFVNRLGNLGRGIIATFWVSVGFSIYADELKELPTQLEGVVILSRHGVRSPLETKASLDSSTSNTWHQWSVKPGHLTNRGYKLMTYMGNYYKEYFLNEKLLSGDGESDKKQVYFHANNPQRTVQTALAIGEGMFPGTSVTVHSEKEGTLDPLFNGMGKIESDLRRAAMEGQYGNNPQAIVELFRPQFDILEKAMGRKGQFTGDHTSLREAAKIIDGFILEYAEGLPFAWGRIGREDLTELFKLASADAYFLSRTPYMSVQRVSNFVIRVGSTFEELAGKSSDYKPLNKAGEKVTFVVGHDTTVSNVAGLLNLNWMLPGYNQNMPALGGALVFELRKGLDGSEAEGQYFVRARYVAQTMEQMRNLEELSLSNPPAESAIFIPGASLAVKNYDAPLAEFVKMTRLVTDPELAEKK